MPCQIDFAVIESAPFASPHGSAGVTHFTLHVSLFRLDGVRTILGKIKEHNEYLQV